MVWTALVLGVVGSLHCAGMCSPLLAAVSGQNPFAITKVIYNSARILAYGSMGMVAATVGSVAGLSGYQFYLSVGLGALLLLAGIGRWHLSAPFLQRPFQFFSNRLKSVFNKFLKQGGAGAIFVLGLANGFLPCGLTYLALTYCFILPNFYDGFFFMVMFGMGTWPVMFGFSYTIQLMVKKINLKVSNVTALAFVFSGMLLMGHAFLTHHHQSSLTTQKVEAIDCK